MTEAVNAYVDGFNLYFGALYDRPHCKWLDVRKLVQRLAGGREVGDVYYFSAQIKQSQDDPSAPNRQNYYLRALRESGTTVVLGSFRKHSGYMNFASENPETITKPPLELVHHDPRSFTSDLFRIAKPALPQAHVAKFEEKGSDVNLASHLLRDVFKGRLKRAMVITGDTDLITPIRMARDEGAFVHSVIPRRSSASREFETIANYTEFLNEEALLASQFDTDLHFKNGNKAVRPKSWA
jgi:uncharacterized LabA/DUF88 family protein